MKKKKKVHTDKKGREFIKESYFVGGKMKSRRVYVVDGIPADEFYEENGTDIDFYMNEDYHLMSYEKELFIDDMFPDDTETIFDDIFPDDKEPENKNDEIEDLPF